MRLSQFILTEMESILVEWEAFASTLLPAAQGMTSLALRDHASKILQAVAADLETWQSQQAQSEKSRGRAPKLADAPETAAETHALLRAKSGFDINQLVAEYRALRASVLRLYAGVHAPSEIGLNEVIRFNEAIDQAITESVLFFNDQVEMTRNLLLGMLGHDMRNPLNAILMTASYLAAMDAGDQVNAAASRLIRSGASIKHLLDDLIDFNRTRFGLGINVTVSDADLSQLIADEVLQICASHPAHRIEVAVSGDTTGRWDGRRLQQLFRNLLSNALTHGARESVVRVDITGREEDVVCEVKNSGRAIDASTLGRMFEPLERGPNLDHRSDAGEGLGLGLYIVQQIARAHRGEVTVRSDDGETVFTVRLPRRVDGPVTRD